jgi:hypothetical protein
VRAITEKAIAEKRWLQMEYLSTKDQSRKEFIVIPDRFALNREGEQVLVATEVTLQKQLSFPVAQILRLRSVDPRTGL